MFDPVPFEKATDADPLFLLQSSLWSTLLGEKRDSYQFDAMERLIVPSSDVDVACARLFGPDVKLEHQSFGDYETTYYYDCLLYTSQGGPRRTARADRRPCA